MSKVQVTVREGTIYVQATGSRIYPVVTTNGVGVVSHVGTVLLAEVADRFGLTAVAEVALPVFGTLAAGADLQTEYVAFAVAVDPDDDVDGPVGWLPSRP